MGNAIDFSLINFHRLFLLQTPLMNVLQPRQKNFSHVFKVHISMYFYPLNRLIHLVLNAKKRKNLADLNRLPSAHKKKTFQKIVGPILF